MDIRLIYASQAVQPMSEKALTSLLVEAREHNGPKAISGLLLYANQSFLQVLEGEAGHVDALYQKIETDPRHRNLRMLARNPIDHRKYGDWSMGFDHVEEARIAALFPGYKPATEHPLVSPDLIRDGTVAEFLLDLYQLNRVEDARQQALPTLDLSLDEFVPR